jgi:DNA phosphorothioation system restriction enzyme
LERGIYHEKIGTFTDVDNNVVSFTGSQNETAGGLVTNFESIDVYWSWDDPQGRAQAKAKDFDRLWTNSGTKGLVVEDFTAVAREVLAKFKSTLPPSFDPEEINWRPAGAANPLSRPTLPPGLELRAYQRDAISSWLKAGGQGIMEMATGSGKTITALAAAAKLSTEIKLQALVVVCPFRHLVLQWNREAREFGLQPILAFEYLASWIDKMNQELASAQTDRGRFLCVITTNATFSSDVFQSRLTYLPKKTMFVADEVHNLGAQNLAKLLPNSVKLRLGLSATPERWFDAEGTEKLLAYFGSILEPRLTLKRALELGALVPYRYQPILVQFTDEERQQYLDLSAKIARSSSAAADSEDQTFLTALLLKRARLIATASNKLVELRTLAGYLRNESHMLFYCGDGSVENSADQSISRQVDEVMRILGHDIGMRVSRYTADEATEEREQMRLEIDSGRLQGLVAIRCLDEGVDIPSIRTAVILASSTNPRQFIQRRGRVLRRCPGKEHATIFDMIVVPPPEASTSESDRSLMRKELRRFVEFADLALNAGEARATILSLQKCFDLMDL